MYVCMYVCIYIIYGCGDMHTTYIYPHNKENMDFLTSKENQNDSSSHARMAQGWTLEGDPGPWQHHMGSTVGFLRIFVWYGWEYSGESMGIWW